MTDYDTALTADLLRQRQRFLRLQALQGESVQLSKGDEMKKPSKGKTPPKPPKKY